jgi:outer membrane protein
MRLTTALRLAPLAAALALAGPARAQAKLGYVDMDRAVAEIGEARAARAELQKDQAQKQSTLDGRKAEIERLQVELQKQAMVLSDEQKLQQGQVIEAKVVEVQKLMLKLQKELAEAEEKAMTPILQRATGILREIAQADGLSAILDKRALVFAEPSLDVTNDLIRKYDAKFPAAKAPAATAPKAPTKPAAASAPAAKK